MFDESKMQHFGSRVTGRAHFRSFVLAAGLLLWGCARSESIEDAANSIANNTELPPAVAPEALSTLDLNQGENPPVQEENSLDTKLNGTADNVCASTPGCTDDGDGLLGQAAGNAAR